MKGVKERGVIVDSRVLGWNNWKKGIAVYCDGEEQVWGKLEKQIQYSSGLFGICIGVLGRGWGLKYKSETHQI